MLEEGPGIALSLDGYTRTVYTTWEFSFSLLTTRARQLLLLIAFLHRDGILENIFRRAASNARTYVPQIPASATEEAAQREVAEYLKLFEDSTGEWRDILFISCITELVSLSLVSFDRANQAYAIHPLVQDWARAMAPDKAAATENTSLLLALSIGWKKDASDYAFRRAMLTHVDAVIGNSLGTNANHAFQFAEVYNATGQHEKAELLEVLVLAASKRVLGKKHPNTLASMANLASTYWKQSRLAEAEALQVPGLAASKRVLGEDHPDTLTSMANLAVTYSKQGRLTDAEVLEVPLLAARKRMLGEEHPDTLTSMASSVAARRALMRRPVSSLDDSARHCLETLLRDRANLLP
jgi:hypothetical protein